MSKRNRTRLGAGLLATVLLSVGGWLLLAPTQIGGPMAYAIINGNSMEPALSGDDLALVRKRSSYGNGDAVLFKSETLDGRHVLHRIVAVEHGRYITRGDNRSTNDPDRLTDADVVGRLWVSIPMVGAVLGWLGQPLHLAVFIFVLVFLVVAGGREVSKRGTRGRPIEAKPVAGIAGARAAAVAGSLLIAGVAAAALFSMLAVVSWTSPETRQESVPDGYAHKGTFAYGTVVHRSPVYPDGRVDTGLSAFVRLVGRVQVSFDYRFNARDPSSVNGAIALDAVISDREGWRRTIELAPLESFSGPQAFVEGTLDLRGLKTLVEQMRALTGSTASSFTVAVVGRVQLLGHTGATAIDANFAPELPLVFDGTALRTDPSVEGWDSKLNPSEDGTTTASVSARVGLGPVSLPTDEARQLSILGIVTGLLLAAAAAFVLGRRILGGEADRIAARFGSRVVDAYATIPPERWVADVGDINSLARIAQHYDRVILHTVDGQADVYLVDDGVAVYRYRTAGSSEAIRSASPVRG